MSSERATRWLPRLDGVLEAALLGFLFLLPFPGVAGARTTLLALAMTLLCTRHWYFGQPWRSGGLWLHWIVALYVAVVAVASVFSVDPALSAKAWRGDLSKFLLSYLLVTEVVRTRRQMTRLFAALALASTVIVLLGIFGGWTRSGMTPVIRHLPLFHNPNIIGAYLLIPTVVLAGLVLAASRLSMRLAWGTLLGASIWLLLTTGSRTSVAATAVALVVSWALAAARFRSLVLVIALLMPAVILASEHSPEVFSRYGSLFEAKTYFPSGDDRSMNDRWMLWKDALTLSAEHPYLGFGYGAGLFSKVSKERDMPSFRRLGQMPHAHNLWLQTAFETGVLGVITWTGVWLGVAVILTRALRAGASTPQRAYAAATAGGLLGAGLQSMTEAQFGVGVFGVLCWVLAGAAASLFLSTAEVPAYDARPSPGPSS